MIVKKTTNKSAIGPITNKNRIIDFINILLRALNISNIFRRIPLEHK